MINEMKVTSLKDLQEYAKGTLVRFSDFAEGQPFIARVKRPSLIDLMASGGIPNSLLGAAQNLFEGHEVKASKKSTYNDMIKVIDIIAENTLIEPSFKEVKEAGIVLTDEQKMEIFGYSQRGIKALEVFREERENLGNNKNGKAIQKKAK